MNPVKVLGACGLLASILTVGAGGFGGSPLLLAAGGVMTFGNIYALIYRRAQ